MLKELQGLGEIFQTNIDHSPAIRETFVSTADRRSVSSETVTTQEGEKKWILRKFRNVPIVAIQKEVSWYKCGSFLINFKYVVLQDTKTGFVTFGQQAHLQKIGMYGSQVFIGRLKFADSRLHRKNSVHGLMPMHSLFLHPPANTVDCNITIRWHSCYYNKSKSIDSNNTFVRSILIILSSHNGTLKQWIAIRAYIYQVLVESALRQLSLETGAKIHKLVLHKT